MERTDKENLQQKQNELDLQPVRGTQGHCLRCEALMISNGQAIQKIKKLKKENQTMQRRLQPWKAKKGKSTKSLADSYYTISDFISLFSI